MERLGWQRNMGETVEPEALRRQLNVLDERRRLFRRLPEMLAKCGVIETAGNAFIVAVGPEGSLPEEAPGDPAAFATWMK